MILCKSPTSSSRVCSCFKSAKNLFFTRDIILITHHKRKPNPILETSRPLSTKHFTIQTTPITCDRIYTHRKMPIPDQKQLEERMKERAEEQQLFQRFQNVATSKLERLSRTTEQQQESLASKKLEFGEEEQKIVSRLVSMGLREGSLAGRGCRERANG